MYMGLEELDFSHPYMALVDRLPNSVHYLNTLKSITMNTVSVHQINDQNNLPFSKEEYSKFKFGSKSIARKYGKELFEKVKIEIIKEYSQIDPQQIVVCSSPYNHVPTATNAMKDYFIEYLNEWLVGVEWPVAQQTKIHRFTSYTEDYGAMSAEQRMELIGGDAFHMDLKFMCNKLVLFMDDIRITGAHEKTIISSASINLASDTEDRYSTLDEWCTPWFLYYAVLSNDQIDPSIENELNYAAITGLKDIINMMYQRDFTFNTRVVKYILKYDHTEFLIAADAWRIWKGIDLLETLYHLAIGNSYHLVPEYQQNLNYLKQLLHEPARVIS